MPTSYNDRKFRLKDAVVAASLANLCFISTWFAFLYDKDFGYFNQQRVTPANLLALLLNLLVFSLLFWFGARALRRAPPHWVRVGAALGILACLVAPVEFFRLFILDIPDHAVLALVRNPIHLAAILVLLGLIVRWPRSVTRLVRPLLVLISPMAAYTVGKSLLLLCHLQTLAQNSEADTPLAQLQSGPPPTRVVWMIFDEMDQRLSFRARPANLKLPEFDRLCAVSLCASNAYPPGGNTLVSIPALLTGKVFSIGQPGSSDDLLLTSMESDRQVRWSQVTNIFDEARGLGLNTALAGWFHPYSRVLGRALNVCEWRSSAIYEHARAATFGRALQNQIFSMFPILNQRSVSVERYRFLMARSTKLVTDPKYGLVFLHLPVPHKPALYRPESGRLTMFGRPFPDGYFDNLQLADRALGELRQAMEQAGAWDTSWVVVSADHWWRESRKYDGQLDYRVPFILKAPGQNGCLPYEPSFNTVFTGELVTAILRQEIRTADEAAAWLDQHAHPVKTAYERSSAGE